MAGFKLSKDFLQPDKEKSFVYEMCATVEFSNPDPALRKRDMSVLSTMLSLLKLNIFNQLELDNYSIFTCLFPLI